MSGYQSEAQRAAAREAGQKAHVEGACGRMVTNAARSVYHGGQTAVDTARNAVSSGLEAARPGDR